MEAVRPLQPATGATSTDGDREADTAAEGAWAARGGKGRGKGKGKSGRKAAKEAASDRSQSDVRDFDCALEAIKASAVSNMLVRLADIQSWLQVSDEAMDKWADLCCGCLCFCFAEGLAGRLSPGMISKYWPRIWDAWLAVSGLSDERVW